MANPLILVTNDDGVHAPGIRALAAALAAVGEVHVVAPDREVSACGQSLTLKHPLRAEQIEPNVWSVDGTPADCVNLALVKLLPRRPELVVSGPTMIGIAFDPRGGMVLCSNETIWHLDVDKQPWRRPSGGV